MKRFKNIYIEITNICNLSCSFCPKTRRSPRAMTAAEFNAVLDKVVRHTEYIYLHVVGEPIMSPELDAILACCERQNAKVKLTTNGTLLKDRLKLILSHSSVKAVNISLSCIKDFGEDSIADYLENVFSSASLLSGNNVTVTLRIWTDIKYIHTVKKKIFDYFNADVSLNCSGIQRIDDRLLLDIGREFVWPIDSTASPSSNKNCLGLRKQLAILSDGTVVPCCLDSEGSIPLGNIFDSSLIEILSRDRSVNIARGFESSIASEPLCQTCTFRKNKPH